MKKNNKYFILTLGCQMNISDSQRIASQLEKLDCQSAPEKEADLVVINACSVRQKAVDRIWGMTKKWAKDKKILITGCVLPTDKKKLVAKNIFVFDIKELPKLGKILGVDNKVTDLDYFHIKAQSDGKIAYIPIMTGCDNFCSYCAVPYTRGREVSRPVDDIIDDIKIELDKGVKELWLLGQNVNSYKYDFAKLLTKVDNLPYEYKFNFMSSNPHDMSRKIIKTFSLLKKWTRELHLPMQSGDDKILRKMNRKYTSNQFLELVANLKNQISNIKISTDIIVGFPTETKEQFENTYNICQKIGFTKAYIGQYSPRPGTASSKMIDDVPAKEKKKRWKKLDQLINH